MTDDQLISATLQAELYQIDLEHIAKQNIAKQWASRIANAIKFCGLMNENPLINLKPIGPHVIYLPKDDGAMIMIDVTDRVRDLLNQADSLDIKWHIEGGDHLVFDDIDFVVIQAPPREVKHALELYYD